MTSEEKYLLSLGKKIERIANKKFSNQSAFSEASGVATRTIRRIIKAQQNPTILVLRKLAFALDISLEEMVRTDIN